MARETLAAELRTVRARHIHSRLRCSGLENVGQRRLLERRARLALDDVDLLTHRNAAKAAGNSVLAKDDTADSGHLKEAERGQRAQRFLASAHALELVHRGHGAAGAWLGQV